MIKAALREAAYAAAPRYVVERYLDRKLISHARALGRIRDSGDEPSVWIDSLWRSHFFRPLQKKSEILDLLERLRPLQPSAICEIGAAGCGTTLLLTQVASVDAILIAIDLEFTVSRQAALESFAQREQQFFCIRQDSHRPETVEIVKDRLAGRRLDVLYLDGDHSYEGIQADFELYGPLVRPGGLIVLHDIVPDFRTRYGIETSSNVGAVPKFWQEIKSSYPRAEEIVEDYAQDGFGIGVLYGPSDNGTKTNV